MRTLLVCDYKILLNDSCAVCVCLLHVCACVSWACIEGGGGEGGKGKEGKGEGVLRKKRQDKGWWEGGTLMVTANSW